MKETIQNVAKQIACLYNNMGMYEIDSKSNPSLAGRYALACDLLNAKIEGIVFVLNHLGFNVHVEGSGMNHTVVVSLSSCHTSPSCFSNRYRRAK